MDPIQDLLTQTVEIKPSDLDLLAGLHPTFRIHGEMAPDESYERLPAIEGNNLCHAR